jgi:hypothetical protein
VPLRLNELGAVFVPVCEPLNPNCWLPPAGIEPFQAAFFTVTAEPDCVVTELHAWVTVWPDGKLNVSVQPLIAVDDVFFTVTFAVKPVFHWLTT